MTQCREGLPCYTFACPGGRCEQGAGERSRFIGSNHRMEVLRPYQATSCSCNTNQLNSILPSAMLFVDRLPFTYCCTSPPPLSLPLLPCPPAGAVRPCQAPRVRLDRRVRRLPSHRLCGGRLLQGGVWGSGVGVSGGDCRALLSAEQGRQGCFTLSDTETSSR